MRLGPVSGFHHRSGKSSVGGLGAGAGRGCDSLVDEALVLLAAPHFPVDSRSLAAVIEAGCTEQLVAAAVDHRLGPVLAAMLETEMTDTVDVPAALRERVASDRVRRLRSMAVLADVASALDGAGLRWAVFKGPVMASYLPRPELRRFNDLDILVPGADLGEAIDVLGGVGIEELNQNWDGYVEHRVGEVPLIAGSVNIDLHWQLVGLGVHRNTMSLDPVAMLDRCRRRSVGRVDVSILGGEDQLLHLALHSALSGAKRLDQLRDIAVLCACDEISWPRFEEVARSAGVAALVSHAIDRARITLGAEVDPGYLRRLGGWSIDARRRFDRRRGKDSSNQTALAVSLWRDTTPNTLRSLAWLIGSRLRSRLGRGVGWDVSDIDGPLYHARDAGGDAQRDVFLRGAAEWP